MGMDFTSDALRAKQEAEWATRGYPRLSDADWETIMTGFSKMTDSDWKELCKLTVPIAESIRKARGQCIIDGNSPDRAQDVAIAAAFVSGLRMALDLLAEK